MRQENELARLASRYVDGTITGPELAELERRVLVEDGAAERLSEWCLMHRQIVDILSEDRLHDLIDQMLVGRPGPPRGVFSEVNQRRSRPKTRPGINSRYLRIRAMWPAGLAVAAGVAGLALFFWWRPTLLRVNPLAAPAFANQPNESAAAGAEGRAAVVASLTQLIDASWRSPEAALEQGQLIAAGGRVQLASGRAKVTFDCGAEVVLLGPCDFELQSSMVAILHSGRLTADVPRRAFGFGVLCPGVDLVDLGTSFGVNVEPHGETELHVFKGEVLCSPNQPRLPGAQSLIHVVENEAKHFSRDGSDSSVGDIAMDVDQFESLLALRRSATTAPAGLASQRLALWLAADRAVVTDTEGRVINWPDLLYGDNSAAEDALQPDPDARPQLAIDAINGLPAVRFDGDSDFLLTTPLETTDDQTVVFVCQFTASALDDARTWGGQIINYDGPPSRYLSDTLEPGVLQIGEPLLEADFRPTLLTSQVFAGFVGATTVEAGRVDGLEIGVGRPTLVAYTYNYGAQKSELRINGELVGTARAFAPQGITSRKIIGRHAWMQLFFHGDLAEMLIYNEALPSGQLRATSQYLADKYAIELHASP
ncbi:FecR protein [Botrimarina colliarenosi]|uniref:FecR protein n=1 Tax=Botrimarina colliarenosi TaxID=2528001 RepID=A0A5C6A0D5_9BACT|nr:LamG-like jellyroll fold domain-containing protein [Botrimarina colliarenosi]TWT92855.1 FecR protein [Botrimarina colliarenosi]